MPSSDSPAWHSETSETRSANKCTHRNIIEFRRLLLEDDRTTKVEFR
jgi:hypothetical protein